MVTIPQEYLNALDALPSFVDMDAVRVVCFSAELLPTLTTRIPQTTTPHDLVWVEPQLNEPLPNLDDIERLVIIASRPLAKILPERKGWQDKPLGMQWGGIRKLKQELKRAGWCFSADYHFHTLQSIFLNLWSQQLTQLNQPARAARWYFAARQHYTTSKPALATVSLLVYEKP